MRHIIAAVFALALCSCAALDNWQAQRELERNCKAAGGTVRGVGMFGTPSCVRPYKDAGKQCQSGSDCEGRCVADFDAPADTTVGACQATTDLSGCHSLVEDGSITTRVCSD